MEKSTMKYWKPMLIAVSALVLIVPLTAVAATSLFDDVADTNPFVNDINWMKTSGVSNGCNPAGTEYCPTDNVTRQQMAAFMHRLATKRVVDAGTLDGRDSGDFVFNASWVKNPRGFSGLAPGNQITAEATCPPNKYVISGGGQSLFKQLVIASSHPNSSNTGWTVIWTNTGTTSIDSTVTPYAMCAGTGLIALP
jgi:hypothetical protein